MFKSQFVKDLVVKAVEQCKSGPTFYRDIANVIRGAKGEEPRDNGYGTEIEFISNETGVEGDTLRMLRHKFDQACTAQKANAQECIANIPVAA